MPQNFYMTDRQRDKSNDQKQTDFFREVMFEFKKLGSKHLALYQKLTEQDKDRF